MYLPWKRYHQNGRLYLSQNFLCFKAAPAREVCPRFLQMRGSRTKHDREFCCTHLNFASSQADDVIVVVEYSDVVRAKPVDYTDVANPVHILTKCVLALLGRSFGFSCSSARRRPCPGGEGALEKDGPHTLLVTPLCADRG